MSELMMFVVGLAVGWLVSQVCEYKKRRKRWQ